MDIKEKWFTFYNKEPTITCVHCELSKEHILNTFKVTMDEYDRHKHKEVVPVVSLFTVYTHPIKDFNRKFSNRTKYIKVWGSKRVYERQYPDKQCQQLVLGTSQTPKTEYWACIDKSNGDQENTWYVWLFHSLKEANEHIKQQKLKQNGADLSAPVPVIDIKVV